MKVIGLIGGITWQSTIMYYNVLNRLAGMHDSDLQSARCLIHSLEFGEISRLQKEDRWDRLDEIMADAGRSLENGGAELIIICANTMHLCIRALRDAVNIPVIHIAEVTAIHVKTKGIDNVALLGTKYTMEQPFFHDVLKAKGINTMIPDEADRDEIHRVIYEELADGTIVPSSRARYIDIIHKLKAEGAQGVILGCTEIPLLIKPGDVDIPSFDTTTLHASWAFQIAVDE